MFDELISELCPEMATKSISAFLDILSVALHLPALWTKVTGAIYDVRESDNFPRTFETHFIFQPLQSCICQNWLCVLIERHCLIFWLVLLTALLHSRIGLVYHWERELLILVVQDGMSMQRLTF